MTDADIDKTCFENPEVLDLVCLPPIDQPDAVLRIVMSLLEGPIDEVLVLDIPMLDGLELKSKNKNNKVDYIRLDKDLNTNNMHTIEFAYWDSLELALSLDTFDLVVFHVLFAFSWLFW